MIVSFTPYNYTHPASGEQISASLPVGYNKFFAGLLRNGKSPFATQHLLKRISTRNYWMESDWKQRRDVPYGRFVAHAIVVGTIQS